MISEFKTGCLCSLDSKYEMYWLGSEQGVYHDMGPLTVSAKEWFKSFWTLLLISLSWNWHEINRSCHCKILEKWKQQKCTWWLIISGDLVWSYLMCGAPNNLETLVSLHTHSWDMGQSDLKTPNTEQYHFIILNMLSFITYQLAYAVFYSKQTVKQ